MFDVFISHSSIDKTQADELCALLEARGISCWIAPRNVPDQSRTEWRPNIYQGICESKSMVVLLSQNSDESKEVAKEIDNARKNKISIIPLGLNGFLPNKLSGRLSIRHVEKLKGDSIEGNKQIIISYVEEVLGKYHKRPAIKKTGEPQFDTQLDIYDKDMYKIGVASRAGVHSEGLWHKTLHCWFISNENGKTFVWFQKRSQNKKDFPGLMDITAGRHLQTGETDREVIGRIKEELGVSVDFHDVYGLGIRPCTDQAGEFYNREFNSIFLYHCPYQLSDFNPNKDEVTGLIRVAADDGLRLFSGHDPAAVAANGIFLDGKRWKENEITLGAADFVLRDEYYRWLFAQAKEYYGKD